MKKINSKNIINQLNKNKVKKEYRLNTTEEKNAFLKDCIDKYTTVVLIGISNNSNEPGVQYFAQGFNEEDKRLIESIYIRVIQRERNN